MTWQERYADIRDSLAEGIDTRFYQIEYVDWLLNTGRAGIFFSDNAAIVVEIRTFPTGTQAVSGLVAAGSKQEIVEQLIPQAEAWGKANGCEIALIESRAGWEREMKKHGYERWQVSLAKGL